MKVNKLKKLINNGFFHIFGSSIINKIVQFCSGIFIIRILNKSDFGVLTYSQNLISFFLLMNGFGILNGLLQFGTKKISDKKKNTYVKFSIKICILSNILITIFIVIYSKFGIFKIDDARNIVLSMSFYPITSILVEFIQIKNRIDLENKKMAFNTNLNTILNLFFMIFFGKIYNIYGIVIGKYLANVITIIYGFSSVKNIYLYWREIPNLKKIEKNKILKFSFVSMLNNGVSQLLYLIDIFLVGVILGSTSIIALYKTGTLIPFALNFIPLSIMTYMYPYFSKNSENLKYLLEKYKTLLKYMILLNGFITLFLLIFSKYIILIVFGEDYMESLKVFQILAIGYFFAATFRIPAGNLLSSIGAIRFNFYTIICCGILNIILDIYLIKFYGSLGAAIATLIIFIISGIMGNYFIYTRIYLKSRNKI